MSNPVLVRVLRAAASLGGALAVSGSVWMLGAGRFEAWWSSWEAFMALAATFFAIFVWVVAPQQPRNRVVWIMTLTAFSGGVHTFGRATFDQLLDDPSFALSAGISVIPASLPADAAWVLAAIEWTSILALFPLFTLGVLLFPDGELPSPRWRWVAVLSVIGVASTAISLTWTLRPWSEVASGQGPLVLTSFLILLPAVLLSLGGMLVRFRSSRGLEREQFKWIVWGTSPLIPVLVVGAVLGGTEYEDLLFIPFLIVLSVFFSSYVIAVGKYRLFDIDVVISRTFVYGTLAVFITGVYVATVVGAGQLIGSGDQPNPVLAIGATAVVAMAFQPLRHRLQRVANRMVYGRRSTPYEVLSTFSQRVAAVDPGVLGQIARALEEGTTAESASIWMRKGEELHLIASWPEDPKAQARVPVGEIPVADESAPVVHDGEQLGLVTLRLSSGQPFSPTDAHLLDQVAAGLGLALRNLKLTEDLRDRVAQLRDSRRRIVAVQDLTRRQLERDLHDGAQQRLVALKIKLGIGASMADKAGLGDVGEVLGDLRREADEAIDSVREFARGIFPPLLEAEGLGPALTARTRSAQVPVTVQAAGLDRYPRDVEATVYFCVLEAVRNALTHAGANSILVTLEESSGQLTFEVRDDGIGFDPAMAPSGSGLTNITDRIDALDGEIEVASSPGRGTAIRGVIPVRELVSTR